MVLGKIFRKIVIVNAVGVDVAYVPPIGYGLPLKRRWRWLLRWTLMKADKVIAISQESAKMLAHIKGKFEKERIFKILVKTVVSERVREHEGRTK